MQKKENKMGGKVRDCLRLSLRCRGRPCKRTEELQGFGWESEGVLGALPQALRDYEPGFFIPHFPQSREPFRIPCFAESEGFEPPDQLPGHRISSAAHSTTPATFLWSI